ncbi:MAG: hypothetical protein M0P27_09760 [Bacteroidales bacterium]|nr:hypothetical protein [Bacteroidales bacterium]
MVTLNPEYVIEKKQRKAVVLPIAEWEHIIDELEELDDIRAYDVAKSGPQESVSFEKAVCEIQDGYGE